jgi:hypothetical protein
MPKNWEPPIPRSPGWSILGAYQGTKEVIDHADTYAEAKHLVREYRLAYGPEWTITCRVAKAND